MDVINEQPQKIIFYSKFFFIFHSFMKTCWNLIIFLCVKVMYCTSVHRFFVRYILSGSNKFTSTACMSVCGLELFFLSSYSVEKSRWCWWWCNMYKSRQDPLKLIPQFNFTFIFSGCCGAHFINKLIHKCILHVFRLLF